EPSGPLVPPVVPLLLDLVTPWQPSVLVIGGPLPALEAAALGEAGCTLETVYSFSAALQRMHLATWNVLVLAPTLQSEGDGVRFVRNFKRADPKLLPPSVADLIPRYAGTPFVIMPVEHSTEYAVFRTRNRWEMADATQTPLAYAILRLRSSTS